MIFDKINIKTEIDYNKFPLPKMNKVRQKFDETCILNVKEEINKQLKKVQKYDLNNKKIGITVGSRGIAGFNIILKELGAFLKRKGAKPVLIPSMGSHGGATVKGQLEVLAGYGITEKALAMPIEASMETEIIGYTKSKVPIHYDKIALGCDGVIVINKIKPHADFKADYESGIVKMMVIGLGKHNGALAVHKNGFENFKSILPEAGEIIINNANILFSIGIVENAYNKPCIIELIEKENIMAREKALLKIAKEKIAKINLKTIDLLIIDEIGKDISGEGMDPNVTGRPGSYLNEGFNAPDIQKIFIRDITDVSHGNGVGIGMADFTVKSLVNKLDLGAMYTNALTATILGPAKLPLVMKNDRQAISIALVSCNNINQLEPRIVRIKNTLELDDIYVSDKLITDVKKSDDLMIIEKDILMKFDKNNNLL
ncbi:MAG: iron-sulfur cluster binding protein [Bacillota bacterium]